VRALSNAAPPYIGHPPHLADLADAEPRRATGAARRMRVAWTQCDYGDGIEQTMQRRAARPAARGDEQLRAAARRGDVQTASTGCA